MPILRRACNWIVELVEEGILEPEGVKCLNGNSLKLRLAECVKHGDCNVNLAGTALALELKEDRERLQSRLQWLESLLEDTIQDVESW